MNPKEAQLHHFIVNGLTLSRAPLALAATVETARGNLGIALGLVAIGFITENLDGKLARIWEVVSKEGHARDPITDASWSAAFIFAYSSAVSEFFMGVPLKENSGLISLTIGLITFAGVGFTEIGLERSKRGTKSKEEDTIFKMKTFAMVKKRLGK